MKNIILNGKNHQTDCQGIFELKDWLGAGEHLSIVNGFQINEDQEIKEGDSICLIKKGVMPDEEELECMMAARHSPYVHEKVKKGSVAIIGLGGLGSNIAVMLARTGIGRVLLVDFDLVEPSNLNRQCYSISHLGMYKTDALKQQIQQINPFIEVLTERIRITRENILEVTRGYEIVCEAVDKAQTKAMIVNELIVGSKTCKIVSGSGMAGYGSSNTIKTTRKMNRLYICGDLVCEAAEGMGLMAPRVTICAGHQANMILRLLLAEQEV